MPAKPVKRTRRSLLQPLVIALAAASALTVLPACADKPPPPITVVLFPATNKMPQDLQTEMATLKDGLRANPRLEVLSYNADAPSFIVAARDAGVDIKNLRSDDNRAALARALGAQLSATISQAHGNNALLDIVVRSVGRASDPLPAGVIGNGESIVAAAQLVTEQARVIDSARNLAPTLTTSIASAAPPPLPPAMQTPAPVSSAPALPVTAPSAPTDQSGAPVPAPVLQPAPATPVVVEHPAAPPVEVKPQPAPISVPAHQVTVAPPPAAPLPQTTPAPIPLPKPVQAAVTPPVVVAPTGSIPSHVTTVEGAPSPSVIVSAAPPPPAPTQQEQPIPIVSAPSVPAPPTPLDADAENWLTLGDGAMARSDTNAAIGNYRRAVDESPRNAAPRIKLAQAYLAAGQSDQALDELRRAAAIEPQSAALKAYLEQVNQSNSMPGADILLLSIQAASTTDDPQALMKLGDAYWNSSRLDLAEKSYTRAAEIGHGSPEPYARLARLYAATERYDLCLDALSHSGATGYASALRIVKQRADNLIADTDTALQVFQTNAQNRTQFYESLKSIDERVGAYATFMAKVKPPQEYKVSYLHRRLAANLLTQVTPELQNYALTGESSFLDHARELEHSAVTELTQANVADKLQSAELTNGKTD